MEAPVFEILSERFVRPSTSTPPSLRSYKLSYTDQLAVPVYIPVALFYPNLNLQASDSPIRSTTQNKTSQILEIALSKTLSYYYPFAGRLRDDHFIECNDMGVHFIEARFRCPMTEFNPQVKDLVFHKSLFDPINAGDASVALVQLSYFDCSGVALSICMSHKLGDASTLCAFMHDWAAMVHQSSHIPSPQFIGASLFPPLEETSSLGSEIPISKSEVPIRKFLFSAPKIAQLKDIAATSRVKNPTRVEVVSALLYRCAMLSSMSTSGSFRHAINIRPAAALPKNCVGNLVTHFSIKTTKEDEMTLPELVSQLRNAKVNVQNEYRKKAKADGSLSIEAAKVLMNQTTSTETNGFYTCTSWCRIPFYDVDFGCGKPLSVGFPNIAGAMNHFTLMDTRNEDSIEAIAMLKDANHMSAFEANEELLTFASLIA